ncbi:hypothetical protein CVT24_008487 [Panaeolus cyanescens]|uniref:G domain-containing protein n=1 Tax=Panaeolus cyanescens TaxID=181874 RepID=A0A409YKM7_9AGAR|nr:hypothetical protein CVT24_008487 [Panaeolus cyanescens]
MSDETLEYRLVTTGTVALIPRSDLCGESYRPFAILLAGPIGSRSGKSSFIEALGDDKALGISKDQLEGFTQNVTAYHAENMKVKYSNGSTFPVCLLDSPGFSDTKISEMEIIEQVKRWMENQHGYVHIILYFCPINGTRIPGSQRRTIEILKSLIGTGDNQEGRFTIATTMWDQVCSKRLQKRAEDNFAYIREILFKDMIEGGSGLTAFTNTQESAVTILDSCIKHANKTEYNATNSIDLGRSQLWITPYGQQLYSDLLGRIEQAWVKKCCLESDLAPTDSALDPELSALLQRQLREIIHTLDKFALQLADFGLAPEGMRGLRGDLADYFIRKYGQRQLYAAVLGPLEEEWQGKLFREQELRGRWINDDPDYKTMIEDELRQATCRLPNLAKHLVEFGPPPDGVSRPQGDLAAYINSTPWLESPQDVDSEPGPVLALQPTSVETPAFAEDQSSVFTSRSKWSLVPQYFVRMLFSIWRKESRV